MFRLYFGSGSISIDSRGCTTYSLSLFNGPVKHGVLQHEFPVWQGNSSSNQLLPGSIISLNSYVGLGLAWTCRTRQVFQPDWIAGLVGPMHNMEMLEFLSRGTIFVAAFVTMAISCCQVLHCPARGVLFPGPIFFMNFHSCGNSGALMQRCQEGSPAHRRCGKFVGHCRDHPKDRVEQDSGCWQLRGKECKGGFSLEGLAVVFKWGVFAPRCIHRTM